MQRRSALARLRRRQRTGPVALLVIFVLVVLFAVRIRAWGATACGGRSCATIGPQRSRSQRRSCALTTRRREAAVTGLVLAEPCSSALQEQSRHTPTSCTPWESSTTSRRRTVASTARATRRDFGNIATESSGYSTETRVCAVTGHAE